MCIGGLGSSLACCFSSAACSLCCAACPSCRNSTATRIGYGLVLIFATALCLISMSSWVEEQLAKIPYLCESVDGSDCSHLAGYFAVYRIMFALTIFFSLMAVLMIGVKNSRDKRAAIQNGFWAPKILVVVGIGVAAFFIPQGSFEDVWMYFGLLGGGAFILVQLILIIDFAYSWNENWVSKMEEDDGRKWFYFLLGATVGVLLLSLTGVILMFVFYGHGDCKLHQFFISFNLILCLLLAAASVTPKVQEANPSSGLLQSALMTGYVMFLTWSALSNSTRAGCNPTLGQILQGKADESRDTTSTHLDASSIVSVLIWVLLVMYSSVSTAGKLGEQNTANDGGFLRMEGAGETEDADDEEGGAKGGQKVHDDEQEGVTYNYTLFHCVLACAALYIMMCLTNWLDPSGDLAAFQHSNAAMWVKIVSGWACIALYGWTLVAPIVLSGRDFSL